MAHYIDADRLKEQIQGLINLGYDKLQGNLYHVLNLIDSLQQEQPEVDLEKEVEKYLLNNADFVTKSTSNEMVNALARHFYELGRNQVLQELYKGKIKPFDKIAATWLDDEQNT